MSSTVFVPFNNDPEQNIALTSAGYTVPAGKFGYMKVRLYNGTMALNAENILYKSGVSELHQSASSTSSSSSELTLVTVGANNGGWGLFYYYLTGPSFAAAFTYRHRRAGVAMDTTSLSVSSSTASGTQASYFLPGDTLTVQYSSGIATTSRTVGFYGIAGYEDYEMWIKAGDVISFATNGFPVGVTGTITLYNAIS